MADGVIYIFAGGGTGGHVYPGLSVAGELVRLRPEVKIVFACSNRAIDRRILEDEPYAIVPQPVRPLPRRPWQVGGFLRAWWSSARQARQMIRDLKPRAVLGLGGFAAGPVVRRAARVGLPSALLNPDAVPGKANQYLARRVDVIFTQFSSTAAAFGTRGRGKVRQVGCPVRAAFASADRAEAVKAFGLDAGKKTLLVLGGSLGAASINEALAHLAGDLADVGETWQVLHVTGPAKADQAPPEGRIAIHRVEYCHRMDLAYAAADLALARAGAGTVAELSATATPAVLMPYPYHKDQHQRLNAGELVEAGAALLCEDRKEAPANAAALRGVLLGILRQDESLARMQARATGAARPDAARVVARWLADQ